MNQNLVKMLTNHILSYYNHLFATSLLYITMVQDPLKDIANTLNGHTTSDHHGSFGFVLADNTDQDYYSTLGVKKEASKQEIHKAFRQLAKKYHPDKNKDKSATDEFIKIFKAYETLSDEKKRKEYDDQANSHTSSWSTASANVNDFDINEFFKQYEDQFLKHAQHHQQQHYTSHQDIHNTMHNHMHQNQFKFHGVNLDDLFHDIDDDEFSSFGNWMDMSSHNHNHYHTQHQNLDQGHFGDGASFFGQHFHQPEIHDTLHQYQHHQGAFQSVNQAGYSCKTTTRQTNGMIMTQTSCS